MDWYQLLEYVDTSKMTGPSRVAFEQTKMAHYDLLMFGALADMMHRIAGACRDRAGEAVASICTGLARAKIGKVNMAYWWLLTPESIFSAQHDASSRLNYAICNVIMAILCNRDTDAIGHLTEAEMTLDLVCAELERNGDSKAWHRANTLRQKTVFMRDVLLPRVYQTR